MFPRKTNVPSNPSILQKCSFCALQAPWRSNSELLSSSSEIVLESLNHRKALAGWSFFLYSWRPNHSCRFPSVAPIMYGTLFMVWHMKDHVQLELKTRFHCKFLLCFGLWKLGSSMKSKDRSLLGLGTRCECWWA
jgi:hypothetical protein